MINIKPYSIIWKVRYVHYLMQSTKPPHSGDDAIITPNSLRNKFLERAQWLIQGPVVGFTSGILIHRPYS